MRFRPVDATFYDLFARSGAHLVRGSALLVDLLGTGPDRAALAAAMRDAEHEADETAHEIVRRVNRRSTAPFDRDDVYALASGLDDVMDFMEEAVDLVVLYEVENLPFAMADQVEVIRRCAELTSDAMARLRCLPDLREYWIEINRLENAGDKHYRRILADLFSGRYDALDVLRLKNVVDSLEGAIDAFESVANTVEQIAVKKG